MVKITAVVFVDGGKTYYFSPGKNCETYEKGMGVIVETTRGLEYATIVLPLGEVDESKIIPPLKPIVRIASERDVETVKRNKERRVEAMEITQEKIAKYKLNMKLIDCDFSFDGAKVVFYYSSPNRVDFRELVKDLSATFKMRIELRQLGIRDEIKMIGGIGICGRECCCSSCRTDFCKVTVKMAKNQNLSLNPTKISGLCGRLMCCLAYENDYYSEAAKHIPKPGSEVLTPDGKGIVVNINMLKMQVRVKIEDKQKDIVAYHDYDVNALKFKHSAKNDDKDDDISDELKQIIDEN